MKQLKTIRVFCGALMLLSMTSCSDFLTESPKGSMNADEFYKTKDGFEYLNKAVYEPLRWVTRNHDAHFYGTDLFTVSGFSDQTFLTHFNDYHKNSLNASNGAIFLLFTDSYSLIQRANTCINRANSADITEAIFKQRTSEARFLRAYAYFTLVEEFGKVPLLTEEVKVPSFTAELASEKNIYAFMVSELEAIHPLLPAKDGGQEWGRVNRAAAKTLLSKVYLTRAYKTFAETGDAQKSFDLAKDIIDNEKYTLLPDFADVFKATNEVNNEVIFSVQWGTNVELNWVGNNDYSIFMPYLQNIPGLTSKTNGVAQRMNGNFAPTRFAYRLFDRSWDTRYDKTFRSAYIANEKGTSPQFGAVNVGDTVIYCTYPDKPWTTAQKATKKYFVVNIDEYYEKKLYDLYSNFPYPGIDKFKDTKALYDDNGNLGTRDHFVYRLGEVYLIAAEAALKAGKPDVGLPYINEIRKRAAINKTTYPMLTTLTIDNILDERGRELLGEESRFMELKRTGKLKERAITNGANERAARAGYYNDNYLYRPLPFDWMRYLRNTVVQNPGYDY